MASPAYGLTGALQQLQPIAIGGQAPNYPAYGGGSSSSLRRQTLAQPQRSTAVSNPMYDYINKQRDLAMLQSQQGIADLQGYAQPGMAAQGMQANFTGANGLAAQQAAYAQFQNSPGQQWLIDQAEQGTLRNAAAIGGLGGGNVRQELQRQAMGLAQQDFQNQFNNLGAVGDRGMQAAQLQTGLRDSSGGYANAAGGYGSNLQQSQIGSDAQRFASQTAANASMANAGRDAETSRYLADLTSATQLARDRGQYSFTAGQDIANNRAGTTSALSGLYGDYTGNMANLLSGAGGAQAQSNQSLASLLANLATGSQNSYVGATQLPGTQQTTGILGSIGNLLGGAGTLMGAV